MVSAVPEPKLDRLDQAPPALSVSFSVTSTSHPDALES
jgi:hypothetical protein